MSSPTTTQPPPPPKSAPSVSILPTQLAKAYSILHPLGLLGLYAVRFNALVEDPVAELLADLPFLAALQIAYVTVCLPAAGTVVDDGDEGKEKEKEKKAAANAGSNASGAGVVLRPGKRGYRRKANGSSSGVWNAVLSKVIVRLPLPPFPRLLSSLPPAICFLHPSHSPNMGA